MSEYSSDLTVHFFVQISRSVAAEVDIVRYQVSKTNGGPAYHEWTGVEFVGPRSPLRGALTAATKAKATSEELEAGYSVTVAGKISREASGEGSQANARGEADEGRQDFPSEDPA